MAGGRVITLCVTLMIFILNSTYGSDKNFILKCCPNGSVLKASKRLYVCDNATESVALDFYDVDIYTYYIRKTEFKVRDVFLIKYLNYTKEYEKSPLLIIQKFFLTKDNLLVRQKTKNAVARWHEVDRKHFCIDYVKTIKNNQTKFKPVFIAEEIQSASFNIHENYIKIVALLVSCVFFLIILLVYCLLPELRNLAGKVMMAYAGSLLCAYGLLAILLLEFILVRIQVHNHVTTTFCVAFSSSIYFFFMASFLWMNVMSWDLWYSFRRLLDFRRPYRSVSPYTFSIYCVYAFGISFGMTLLFVLMNQYPLPGVITPSIPEQGCFIDEPEKMLYFYVPMLILVSCNWIFFIMTAYNFWQYDNENRILNRQNLTRQANATRQRFIMYIKFSLLMGISFILEAASSKAPQLSVWYISDMYNMLIGVAFFVILVCKKRILRKIIKKIRFCGNSEGLNATISRGVGSQNTNASKSYSNQSERPEP